MRRTALVGITAALSLFFIGLAFKASSIRSWLQKRTDTRRKKAKRRRSNPVKSAAIYVAPEEADKEDSDLERDFWCEVPYSGFDKSQKYHERLTSSPTSSGRESSIQSEHGAEDSDRSTGSSLDSSNLNDDSTESPSDHDREARTTKKRPPAGLTHQVSKRARATALVDPVLRLVRRRRRARSSDIETGESSSMSESDLS